MNSDSYFSFICINCHAVSLATKLFSWCLTIVFGGGKICSIEWYFFLDQVNFFIVFCILFVGLAVFLLTGQFIPDFLFSRSKVMVVK